jgi:hypothetical protein
MRRAVFPALMLVAVACGGSPAAETAPTTVVSSTAAVTTTVGTTVPATTISAGTTSEATTTTVPRVRPEGRDAPDFTLALGEGGLFTLSEDHRPVFLLFWAEW